MPIEEIFKKATANDVISELKSCRFIPQPDVERAEKALNPKLHDINDPIIRKDKRVKIDADDEAESAQKIITVDGERTNYRTEKVARIALAIQRLIINRAVSFCFGNPINYNATPTNDNEALILHALNRILYDVKCNSLNRKIGRSIFGYKECAEYWYTVEKPNSKYGFKTKHKLRCALFSPAYGDTLYPYFDETGDMVAFSRAFSRKDAGENAVDYFETFTDKEHWLWINGANGYEAAPGYPKPIKIGKIPIIYGVIEGEDGATMQYVSWQSAPEAVKLEIETLLKMIYTITQTPDISFDAVKGLSAISGIALKLLFMDAHLKVQDKREIFDDYLQRRVNVILAYIGKMNTALETDCDTIAIEPEIVPYMLTSEIDELNYWLTANGNKPVISQEESVEKAGLSNNVELTMQKLKDQATTENSFIIGEPQLEMDA